MRASDAGFHFRYRLSGGAPTVRRFRLKDSALLTRGDMLSLEHGRVALAASGDRCVLGAAIETRSAAARPGYLNAITDADAVYGVHDGGGHDPDEELCLVGGTGGQGLAPGEARDVLVVGSSRKTGETLVRLVARRDGATVVSSVDRASRLLAPRAVGGRPPGEHRHTSSPLSAALERELVLAAAAGDPAARELLVGAFMPAISGIARYYRRPGSVDRDELLQEGVVGLMRALSRFDPDVGTPFWGYASWWVRQAMQHLVAEVARPTVLSDRALRGLARVREARRADLQREGREPTVGELAEQVGLPREHVECLLAVERAPRGLEEPVGSDPGGTTTLRDTLADPVGEDAYENVLDDFGVEDLRDLAESLGEREREVLFDHFGLGRDAKTLREIGEGLGVSAERVRQIEAQALAKLRSRSDAGA